MRLVIIWNYDYKETVPIEYSSAEAFLADFEIAIRQESQSLVFANCIWPVDQFLINFANDGKVYYCPPTVITVDEWFAGDY